MRGVGLGLVFVPLTNLAISGLPMNKIPAGTGLFNLTRQLGGSVGIALGATLLPRLSSEARGVLAANITRYGEVARERVAAMTQAMMARGVPAGMAELQALRMLDLTVSRQATMLALERIFSVFGLVFLLGLPLLLLMRRGRAAVASGMAH